MRTFYLWLGICVWLSLVLITACAPAAPGPGIVGESAAPAAQEAAVAAPAAEQLSITLVAGVNDVASEDLLRKQIDRFQEQSQILVNLVFFPRSELREKLVVILASGEPFDVVTLPTAGALQLLNEGVVTPVQLADESGYLPDALANVNFNGEYVGAPWRRGAKCSPYYDALSIPSTSIQVEAANQLIRFLTDSEQQIENFTESGGQVLPTRTSVYESLGIECPVRGIVLQPSPAEQARIVAIVEERLPRLQPILEENSAALLEMGLLPQPQFFDVGRSTGAIGSLDPQNGISSQESEPEGPLLAAIVPIGVDFSRENLDKALFSDAGVIVGALFGVDEQRLQLGFSDSTFDIEPGQDFAVKWRAVDPDNLDNPDNLKQVHVFFVSVGPDGKGIEQEVGISLLEEMRLGEGEAVPGQPTITIEVVNPCLIYYKVDDRTTSTRVFNALQGLLGWLLNVQNIVSYSYSCE